MYMLMIMVKNLMETIMYEYVLLIMVKYLMETMIYVR